MPNSTFVPNRVRLLVFVQKLDSLSYEEFFRYWREEHARIFLNEVPIVKKAVLKYEQLHLNEEVKAKIKASGPVTVPDYDGVVLIECESVQKAFEVMQDPEYTGKVVEDGKKLFKLDKLAIGLYQIAGIFDELPPADYEKGSVRKDNFRVVANVFKKDDMDYAAFSKYWKDDHGRGFADLIQGKGHSLKYEQAHKHPDVDPNIPNLAKIDGVTFIESTKWENILGPFADPEFGKWSQADSPNYASASHGLELLPVNVVTFIDN